MEGIAKNLVVDIWDQLEFMALGKDWDFFSQEVLFSHKYVLTFLKRGLCAHIIAKALTNGLLVIYV